MKRLLTLAVVMIALFAGVYMADKAGWIDIDPGTPPRADSLYAVSWLDTSSIDRSENREEISGNVLMYQMSDPDMDGIGDANLDLRVTNTNIGGGDEVWAFSAEVTQVDFAITGGQKVYIVNQTDLNTRWDYSITGSEAGSPTFSQSGNVATSNDFKTGASEQLNIDLRLSPTAGALMASPDYFVLQFSIGGKMMQLELKET